MLNKLINNYLILINKQNIPTSNSTKTKSY